MESFLFTWYAHYFTFTLILLLFSIAILLTSLLLPSFLLLGGSSGFEHLSPTNSTNSLSFSALLPQRMTPLLQFSETSLDTFAFYVDSHCPTEEYWYLFPLSSAAAFFTSLALNAAKFSIPFGRIKRQPQAWWSTEVEEAVSEGRKAFAVVHRSDENRPA